MWPISRTNVNKNQYTHMQYYIYINIQGHRMICQGWKKRPSFDLGHQKGSFSLLEKGFLEFSERSFETGPAGILLNSLPSKSELSPRNSASSSVRKTVQFTTIHTYSAEVRKLKCIWILFLLSISLNFYLKYVQIHKISIKKQGHTSFILVRIQWCRPKF